MSKFVFTEQEPFGAKGDETRVIRVTIEGQDPTWQGADVWVSKFDRSCRCTQCSTPAVAMSASCAHARAVKRHVAKASTISIKVGQLWQEVDPRFDNPPLREVVKVGEPRMFKASRSRTFEVRDITLKNVQTNRTSLARSDRFNGARGGYKLAKDMP